MKILIVAASFNQDITASLVAGATRVLDSAKRSYEVIEVPGALEIPATIAMAHTSGLYDAYIAIGCVIRGETYHFEVVCNESARGLSVLSLERNFAIGNGIITVENEEQAWARAHSQRLNKGGDAAKTALKMLEIKKRFELN